MRTINKLFLIGICLTLVIGFTSSAFGQFTIKGETIDKYKLDVLVYAYDESTKKWEEIQTLHNKVRYKLVLDPTLHHTIVFFGNNKMKTLQVKAGEKGNWLKYIDLDFNVNDNLTACLIQSEDDYLIYIVDKEYSVITASK